jgi:large subunit ribosomal protein L15
MRLNELGPPSGAIKRKKRLGRGVGSGRGKTAGKGSKGQNCRSGGGVPPWFEGGQMPLQRRVPKRGFTNKFKASYQIVNLGDLNKFEKGEKVNRKTLMEKGMINRLTLPVKVLGDGELKVPLEVDVDAVSKSAAKAIHESGGSVNVLPGRKSWRRKRKKGMKKQVKGGDISGEKGTSEGKTSKSDGVSGKSDEQAVSQDEKAADEGELTVGKDKQVTSQDEQAVSQDEKAGDEGKRAVVKDEQSVSKEDEQVQESEASSKGEDREKEDKGQEKGPAGDRENS